MLPWSVFALNAVYVGIFLYALPTTRCIIVWRVWYEGVYFGGKLSHEIHNLHKNSIKSDVLVESRNDHMNVDEWKNSCDMQYLHV